MRRSSTLAAFLVAALLALPARAEQGPPGMTWIEGLAEAFRLAKEQDKPILVCINAAQVDGRRRQEPAAKELRDKTYRDAKVIELSKKFVCTYLTAAGSSSDFGELRLRYGIDGEIVSPQHIFAFPDGRLIMRREYWPYGYGQKAVDALLGLMNDALERDAARRGAPSTGPDTTPPDGGEPGEMPDGSTDDAPAYGEVEIPPVPEDDEARARWIEEIVVRAKSLDEIERRAALTALLDADREGDIVTRLVDFFDDLDKHLDLQVDVVRAFGRPGLEPAVGPLTKWLREKEDRIRANAAVSLEYVGSKEAVRLLKTYAQKEKDDDIANHMYRALGRCGAGDAKVRSLLVKKAQGAKSERASYGPLIGLAYFEKDPKAARAVEKLLKKWGVPSGGGRGGWRGGLRRTLTTWCLTEVAFEDAKAAKFLREEMVESIPESRWAGAIRDFYESAAEVCDGNAEAKADIDGGVRFAMGRRRGGNNPFVDEARSDRSAKGFEPKGEWGSGSR